MIFNFSSFAKYIYILICVNPYSVIIFHFRNYPLEVRTSTNDFRCQQYYSEDYINSAHDFKLDCSNQNRSYTACNHCIQGIQDLEFVLIYDTHSLTSF